MQHVWSRRCSKHQIGRLVDGDLLDTRRSTNIMIFGIALGSLWASRFRHVIFPITITIIVDKRIVEAGWTHTIDLGHACKTRGPTNLPLARLRAPGCWRGVADLRRRFRAFLFSVTREQRSMQMGVCLAAHFRRRDDRMTSCSTKWRPRISMVKPRPAKASKLPPAAREMLSKTLAAVAPFTWRPVWPSWRLVFTVTKKCALSEQPADSPLPSHQHTW